MSELITRCAWKLAGCEDANKPEPAGPVSHRLCPPCGAENHRRLLEWAATLPPRKERRRS